VQFLCIRDPCSLKGNTIMNSVVSLQFKLFEEGTYRLAS
jgi:hypothetical protein